VPYQHSINICLLEDCLGCQHKTFFPIIKVELFIIFFPSNINIFFILFNDTFSSIPNWGELWEKSTKLVATGSPSLLDCQPILTLFHELWIVVGRKIFVFPIICIWRQINKGKKTYENTNDEMVFIPLNLFVWIDFNTSNIFSLKWWPFFELRLPTRGNFYLIARSGQGNVWNNPEGRNVETNKKT